MANEGKLISIHTSILTEINKTKSQFLDASVHPGKFMSELIFCLCTPQSSARRSWEATKIIMQHRFFNDHSKIAGVLAGQGVRFKNNKAGHIVTAMRNLDQIYSFIQCHRTADRIELRNAVSEMVRGYGLKEASHFLRNIGLGDGLCILDRHILRCLNEYEVIEEIPKTLSKSIYLETEQKMLHFAKDIRISPIDLDFVFWYHQNGEIFK